MIIVSEHTYLPASNVGLAMGDISALKKSIPSVGFSGLGRITSAVTRAATLCT